VTPAERTRPVSHEPHQADRAGVVAPRHVRWATMLCLGLLLFSAGCGAIGNTLHAPMDAARSAPLGATKSSREPRPETLRKQVEADPFPPAAKVGL